MKVSIIVLNWNGGAEDCLEAIKSVLNQDYPNKEVIFVDNGSTDGSLASVKLVYPNIHYIELLQNIGCPPGRNVGAKAATGDLLFFVENDGAWDRSDVISSAVTLFEIQHDLGAIYTMVEGYKSGTADSPLDPFPPMETSKGLFLSSSFRGGASVIRAELFFRLGGFPNDFFRQGEERYLSLRIYGEGFKVVYWPECSLRHKGSDYFGKATVVSKFNIENNLKTIVRLYPLVPMVIIGIPKWIVGGFVLLREGMFNEFLRISIDLFRELFNNRGHLRVSSKTFCEVETLRQGIVDNYYIESRIRALPMISLLYRRLIQGK